MTHITALFAGLVFGLGLIVSGMISPNKVKAFLDVVGAWDIGLAWVMIGAILTTLPGYALLKSWKQPLFADTFQWPGRTVIDRKLVIGAVLFGLGWGLGGFCPGPVLTGLFTGNLQVLVVIAAMFAGFLIAPWLERKL